MFCSITSDVVSLRVGSVSQLLSPDEWLKKRGIYMRIAGFCIMAERTKHIHAQPSFHLLPERHGTLAKRLVGETTGYRVDYWQVLYMH